VFAFPVLSYWPDVELKMLDFPITAEHRVRCDAMFLVVWGAWRKLRPNSLRARRVFVLSGIVFVLKFFEPDLIAENARIGLRR
jgi:hypothetical protein